MASSTTIFLGYVPWRIIEKKRKLFEPNIKLVIEYYYRGLYVYKHVKSMRLAAKRFMAQIFVLW